MWNLPECLPHRRNQRRRQGRENAKQYLLENPEVYTEVEKIVRDHYFAQPDGDDNTEEAAAPASSKKAAADDKD